MVVVAMALGRLVTPQKQTSGCVGSRFWVCGVWVTSAPLSMPFVDAHVDGSWRLSAC